MLSSISLSSSNITNSYPKDKSRTNHHLPAFKSNQNSNSGERQAINPFVLKIIDFFKAKKQEKIIKVPNDIDLNKLEPPLSREEFIKTKEGQRRANLTQDEIAEEINLLFEDALKRYNIEQKYAPKLIIQNDKDVYTGGGYSSKDHLIKINPLAYVNGCLDLEEIIYHEMNHCKNALLRSQLDIETKESVIKGELLKEISSQSRKKVLCGGTWFIVIMTDKPILDEVTQKKFTAFAKKYLFSNDTELQNYLKILSSDSKFKFFDIPEDEKIKNQKNLIKYREKFPDLERELEDIVNSAEDLGKKNNLTMDSPKTLISSYALSLAFRYSYFLEDGQIQDSSLNAEDRELAVRSLIGHMDSINGNAVFDASVFKDVSDEEYLQYKFSQEEYDSRKEATTIQKRIIEKKLQNNNLSDEENKYWTQKLLLIKARENKDFIGFKLYKLKNEYAENPTKELKKEIRLVTKELKKYKNVK